MRYTGLMQYAEPASMNRISQALPARYAFLRSKFDEQELATWNKSVGGACDKLAEALADTRKLRSRFWCAAHMARAAVDSLLAPKERISLVNDATALALGVYAGVGDAALLENVTERFKQHGLYDKSLEWHDRDLYLSRTAARSARVAARIENRVQGPVLFIPVSHSGFVPGMLAFLRHQRHRSDGIIYPARYSIYKSEDCEPQISEPEIKYLAALSKDKTVIVYDNDAVSGTTMNGMMGHLNGRLAGSRAVLGYVNEDSRDPGAVLRQGRHWEVY